MYRAKRNEAPHKITPIFFFFCYKTWFLYSKVKQSSYAKLALHKGEFNARLQSTGVSLMANCLSKLKRKEQMIRYKKVLKASTKGHFTNIISAARGLPAGLFRPRPCTAMKSGVRGAICLARAHFLPNEYNKNPRGDISVKIGISPNRRDGRVLQRRPLLSLPALGAEGALPSREDTTPNSPLPHVQGQQGASTGLGVVSTKESRLHRSQLFPAFSGLEEDRPGLSPRSRRRGHRPARAFLKHGAGLRGRRLLQPAHPPRLGRMQNIIRRPPSPRRHQIYISRHICCSKLIKPESNQNTCARRTEANSGLG